MASKIKTKTVTQVQIQETVRTIIREQPDGTKETIIIENRIIDRLKVRTKEIPVGKKWLIGVSGGLPRGAIHGVAYTLSVQRRILWGAYMGLYMRSDKELGVSLSYNF